MEIIITAKQLKKYMQYMRILVCLCFIVAIGHKGTFAQKVYTIKDGKMYIELSKKISEVDLDKFISQFNLSGIGLKNFIQKNDPDSIYKNGWKINKNNNEVIAISKPLVSSDDINNLAEQLVLSVADRFPAVRSGLIVGYNKFKNIQPFEIHDSKVRFFLRKNTGAKRVILAGSFNGFSTSALPMTKTDSGWIADVKLSPGKYWYKFIVDGDWMVDEDNQLRENDGEGNTNSVFYRTNTRFYLNGYSNAKKVFLAGSFNNWQRGELRMQRTSTGWELPLYLAEGTYTYRFVADGNWFSDPANSEKMPNEFGEYNSVIKLGYPYLFRLSGFTEARKVLLTGSFNGWRKDELFMKKTGTGWELPYTLGFGNYEYRFIIDGAEITDPANTPNYGTVDKKRNSVLILGGNYTFRLKGFQDAKTILIAGDFNNFNEHDYVMKKEGGEWVFNVHLSIGKHLYKYIVDGKWLVDPGNKLWEQNEFGTGNSVIWIEPKDQIKMQ